MEEKTWLFSSARPSPEMQHAVVYCLPSDGSGGPGLGPQGSVETQNNGSRQLDAAGRPLSEQPLDAASGAELI